MVESIAESSLPQLRSRKAKSEVAELERKIGQQTMENAVLRRCLQRAAETAGIDYARLIHPFLEQEVKLASAGSCIG